MELIETYRELDLGLQEDIAIVSLPMGSRKHNAVMVNVLQRASTVIVQNSLREGFGLTVTEAMWKRAAVLGTWACGIRQQIRDGTDGRLIHNPEDPDEIASLLNHVLEDYRRRAHWAQNAQRRVHSEFLVFNQVARWLRVLTERVSP
jgi:trehalose synthase